MKIQLIISIRNGFINYNSRLPSSLDDNVKRGSLYIVMAETGDAGVYTCKTTYGGETYEVAKVNLQVQVRRS